MERCASLLNRINSLPSLSCVPEYLFSFVEVEAGLKKFARLVESELKHLSKSTSVDNALKTSNLVYLEAMFDVIEPHWGKGLVSIRSKIGDDILIDLIVDWGFHWIKISSRNLKNLQIYSDELEIFYQDSIDEEPEDNALSTSSHSSSADGLTNDEFDPVIVKHAKEWSKLAGASKKERSVSFYFKFGVPDFLKSILEKYCIEVFSKKIPLPKSPDIMIISKTINLDVTTLIAATSNFLYENDYLTAAFKNNSFILQQKKEKMLPLFPILRKYFTGRDAIVCRSAYERFQQIINTVGGLSERQRWKDFQARASQLGQCLTSFRIVEDADFEDALIDSVIAFTSLNKAVFKVGNQCSATTFTSNVGVVRSAASAGLELDVFVHEERSLSEDKYVHLNKL